LKYFNLIVIHALGVVLVCAHLFRNFQSSKREGTY